MTTPNTRPEHDGSVCSPFTGADVCDLAGLMLPQGTRRPVFDDDLWNFTEVVGLPVQLPLANRRFDFAGISDLRWRLVAKELIMALLAPHHLAVAPLPRAYRTPLHLTSCAARLGELTRLFTWLEKRNVTSLTGIDTHTCEAYLHFRRYITDDGGTVVGEQSPAVRRAAAQIVVDLVGYRDLFTADRVHAELRPWGGATASAVAEMRSGRQGNTTPAVSEEILQPLLSAALHLVEVLGPHAVELNNQIRRTDAVSSLKRAGLRHSTPRALEDILDVLADYTSTATPLPMLEDHDIARRLATGWSPEDPLLPIATGVIARRAGYSQLWQHWKPALREPLTAAAESVGVEKAFAHNAPIALTADGSGEIPWTAPLHRSQAVGLIGFVRTAAVIVLAATSGLRASELMELRVGCRRPVEEPIPGLKRFRVASKIVKGQPLGGTDDEWVIIEPAYRAIELAEQLHDDPAKECRCSAVSPSTSATPGSATG
jgi:hypothetical protein